MLHNVSGSGEPMFGFGRKSKAPFSKADLNKTVRVQGDYVWLNEAPRVVIWVDTPHHDCNGRIVSVSRSKVRHRPRPEGLYKNYCCIGHYLRHSARS